ncbi:MAG: RIP metalloprotease RseP [Candidatus Omnitrophica bacterium]|nr:RIP metalloprotease RseP [Candidatus Omnitrophota bacterium]
MLNFLISLIVLGLLVVVHEAGHFFVARWAGVRVLRFSIGFGPKLFSWTRGETEYAVSAIPLGGYVKMAGEQRTEHTHQPWEYLSKPVSTRAAIVTAGPLVNYLVAFLCLWAVFIVGYHELLPVIGKVMDKMPAQAAGFQPGDRVRAIGGKSVATWEELTKTVYAAPDVPLAFAVEREGGQALTVMVTPKATDSTDHFGRPKTIGLIGVAPKGDYRLFRTGPIAAFGRAVELQQEIASQTMVALWLMVTGKLSAQQSVTGPIGIVVMASEALRLGLASTLTFVGLISFSLALFNVFPIPILDGGHLLFLALEKLRGRPVSVNIQERAAQVSFLVLVTFVLVICINDVNRFGLLEKAVGWMKR